MTEPWEEPQLNAFSWNCNNYPTYTITYTEARAFSSSVSPYIYSEFLGSVGMGSTWTCSSGLSAAITSTTQTTIAIDSASTDPIFCGVLIQIDSEKMQVSSLTGTSTLTVFRGACGTTPATHANAAAVTILLDTGEKGGKAVINGDCSIATGADSKIARQEQGESTWDPLNACELAPNSANSLIPSLIAWAKSQPPGNVAIVSINGYILSYDARTTNPKTRTEGRRSEQLTNQSRTAIRVQGEGLSFVTKIQPTEVEGMTSLAPGLFDIAERVRSMFSHACACSSLCPLLFVLSGCL